MPELFAKLPFLQAIEALADRLAIPKVVFMELDAANRSRAFTMARIADLNVLQSVHDELTIAINDGETFAQFKQRLKDVQERTGWTGTNPWHYRQVYDMNLGMAYSAGRFQQGTESGLKVVRILPSISKEKRPDHAMLAGQLFRFEPGTMLPPWDFGCQCGWEWVFPEELEAMGTRPEDLPALPFTGAGQEFQWRPDSYAKLTIEPGRYTGALAALAGVLSEAAGG
ncbi:MAG TPA: phage minor head protein [Thermoguttaceae bacterium]|nr:phage minor head protein [Thermoguttaceae bacterium]